MFGALVGPVVVAIPEHSAATVSAVSLHNSDTLWHILLFTTVCWRMSD